jgi:multiple sugar transport system ATP-binding protein
MIFVTHDQVEAMTLADRIVVLRAGVVEQVGTPLELYNAPENLFVAGFIGSPRMNFIPGEVTAGGDGRVTVRLETGLELAAPIDGTPPATGDKVTLGVRPENIVVAEASQAMLTGEVQIAEHLGGETFVYVNLPTGRSVTVEIQGQADVRVGDPIGLSFAETAYHLFSADERVIRKRRMDA